MVLQHSLEAEASNDLAANAKLYRAVSHPLGWSGLPDYEVR
jgi:hypothetical protein